MNSNTLEAANLLKSGSYTCLLYRGEATYTSTERGVKPLINWLDSGKNFKGYCAADKIVGKAAAMLYLLLGVSEVYAPVMSEAAQYTLAKNGVVPYCGQSVKKIMNRLGTGNCPMEDAVENLEIPEEAYRALKKAVFH